MPRLTLIGILSVALLAPAVALAPASAEGPPERARCFERPVQAQEHPGRISREGCTFDGVEVVDGAAAAFAPRVGETVTVHALAEEGDQEVTIYRESEGVLVIRGAGKEGAATHHDSARGSGAAGTTDAAASEMSPYSTVDDSRGCAAYGYGLKPWSHYTFGWRYNASGTVGNITAAQGLDEVRAAITNLTSRRNNCGGYNNGALSNTYAGTTSSAPGFTSAGSCSSNDGSNVIGWKTISSNVFMVTCTYSEASGSITTWKNSDIVINNRYGWTAGIEATCSVTGILGTPRYDIQGIMTHEAGHVFGLADKYGSSDGDLTMYGYGQLCTDHQRTLAVGDLDGLRFYYP